MFLLKFLDSIVVLHRVYSYINALEENFRGMLTNLQFSERQMLIDESDAFIASKIKMSLYSNRNSSDSTPFKTYSDVQNFISTLDILHAQYIDEICAKCKLVVMDNSEISINEKTAFASKYNEFNRKLHVELKPSNYCKEFLIDYQQVVNDSITFNDAIKTLDTEVVAKFLQCKSLTKQEVIHRLSIAYSKNLLQYCSKEYVAQSSRQAAYNVMRCEAISATDAVITHIACDVRNSFEASCVKNSSFDEISEVSDRLARAAVINGWVKFLQSLSFIETSYDYEFTNDLVDDVYASVFLNM